jgi:PPOX class probable F420-dependent enzyme
MIDLTAKAGQRTADRLATEIVAWLTTVNEAGQPQGSPVWFLWSDGEFYIRSLATTPRVRNIRRQPRVSIHLNSDFEGGDVVTFEGEARIDESPGTPPEDADYFVKYAASVRASGWTPESFAIDYPTIVRIRPTRVRTG